jgi:hypothetical protein
MGTATNLITGGDPDTTNGTSYVSPSHTPPANQTLVYMVQASGTTATAPTLTASANSLTFTLVEQATKNTSADRQYLFVANQATPGSPVAMTVTFDCSADAATGAIISGVGYDITKVGTAAIRQSAKVDNVAGGTAPATTFAAAALTTNPTIFAFHVGVTTGSTPPTNWTEQVDANYSTPAQGGGYATRDSGFTGTTVTLGSSTNGACSAVAVELDASSGTTPVSTTRATTWDVLATVTATRATTWDVLASVSTSRATTWDTLAQVSTTRATTWDTLAAVTASRATTWDVLSTVSTQRSTTWNVDSTLTPVSTTRATTWRVLAQVAVSRATTWDTLANVANTKATTWDVLARIDATRGTTWRTLSTADAARVATWRTLAQAQTTRATTWNVLFDSSSLRDIQATATLHQSYTATLTRRALTATLEQAHDADLERRTLAATLHQPWEASLDA